jgi:hypothetical protein
MCTVTYLPYHDGFILTHNRDEAPTRSPNLISRENRGGDRLIFPKDTKAGGGWVAAARSGRVACLLNGAFVKHQHQPPYRRSRGLVLLDFFDWPDPDDFLTRYELDDIEPFTFLFFATGRVTELRWDGAHRHRLDLSAAAPHFWCSATLYPPPMQALREQVFQEWLSRHVPSLVNGHSSLVIRHSSFSPSTPEVSGATIHPPPSTVPRQPSTVYRPPSTVHRPPSTVHRLPSTVYKLHQSGSVGDPENDYVMNRGGRVCTVSITQIVLRDSQVRMRYNDLLEGRSDIKRLSLDTHRSHIVDKDK